jgi:hypothetical protein
LEPQLKPAGQATCEHLLKQKLGSAELGVMGWQDWALSCGQSELPRPWLQAAKHDPERQSEL